MNLNKTTVLVTGGHGFLGGALVRRLNDAGAILELTSTKKGHDLRDRDICRKIINEIEPQIIVHLAAVVGGIGANQNNPGKFFYDNMVMGLNMIDEAHKCPSVEKFVQVGSICAYPKFTPIPFKEENLWNGYPEETNAPYGIAKKALLVMLQGYRQQYNFNGIYLLPVNMYGPNDNFDLDSSHVIPALIRKFMDAVKHNTDEVVCWGTGEASREFLYRDDCADAIVLAIEKYDAPEPINIGTGCEIKIKDLAMLIAELCDFKGKIIWDHSKPDGQPRRCLDVSRAAERLGFKAKWDLRRGLEYTINWYKQTLFVDQENDAKIH